MCVKAKAVNVICRKFNAVNRVHETQYVMHLRSIQHEIWSSVQNTNYSFTPQNFVGSKGFRNRSIAVNITEIQLSPFLNRVQTNTYLGSFNIETVLYIIILIFIILIN